MRRALVLLVVLCGVTVLAGCGSSSTRIAAAPAATVNDVDIPAEAVFDQLDAATAVAAYGQAFGLQEGVTGATAGTYDTTAVASVLNTLVSFELAVQEVEALELEVTDQDLTNAEQQVDSILGSIDPLAQTDEEFGAEQAAQVPEPARRRLVDGVAAVTVLQAYFGRDVPIEEVTDEQVAQFYAENPDAVGGEPFEAVEADIRAYLEEQAAQAAQQAAQEPFSDWLTGALLDADVVIDPRFGRWTYVVADELGGVEEVDDPADAQSAGVFPPEGPQAPPTTTPPEVDPLVPPPG